MEHSVHVLVAFDLVAVESSVLKLSVIVNDALGNVHYLTGVILQLVREHDYGKSKCHLLHRDLHVDGKSSLREEGNTTMSIPSTAAVNGRYNGMVGRACFYCGVCFRVSHLSHAYHVGVETERSHYQILLGNIIDVLIRWARKCVNHVIDDSALLVSLDKGKLSRTAFNRIDTFTVGDRTEERVQKRCLTGACSTCNNERHAITKAGFKERKHIVGE